MRKDPAVESLGQQIVRLRWVWVAIYTPAALVVAGLALLRLVADTPISILTRDPLAIVETALEEVQRHPEEGIHALARLNLPFYIGAVSDLGVLTWCAGAVIALFAAYHIRQKTERKPARRFLIMAAALSLVLMCDDLLLLHERAIPYYLNLSEHYLFALYAAYTCLLLGLNRRFILRSDYSLLVAALAAFALSLAVDHSPIALPAPYLLEDGAKFVGIVGWTGYLIHTSAQQLAAEA